jgi:hypothetical protein
MEAYLERYPMAKKIIDSLSKFKRRVVKIRNTAIKNVSHDRVETNRTGGGTFTRKATDFDRQVIACTEGARVIFEDDYGEGKIACTTLVSTIELIAISDLYLYHSLSLSL